MMRALHPPRVLEAKNCLLKPGHRAIVGFAPEHRGTALAVRVAKSFQGHVVALAGDRAAAAAYSGIFNSSAVFTYGASGLDLNAIHGYIMGVSARGQDRPVLVVVDFVQKLLNLIPPDYYGRRFSQDTSSLRTWIEWLTDYFDFGQNSQHVAVLFSLQIDPNPETGAVLDQLSNLARINPYTMRSQVQIGRGGICSMRAEIGNVLWLKGSQGGYVTDL